MRTALELEDILIQQYIESFRQITGKNLLEELTIRGQITSNGNIYFTVSLDDIFNLVNGEIPEHMHIYSKTIATKSRKRQLVNLKKIFSCICLDLGYDIKQIYRKIKMDRTTVLHYKNEMRYQLSEHITFADLILSYNIILTKIQNLHARNIQFNTQTKPDSQPGLSSVLHTGKGIPGTDQRQFGAEITDTGMGNIEHAVDRKIGLLSENAA